MSSFKHRVVIIVCLLLALTCYCLVASKFKIESLVSGSQTRDVALSFTYMRNISKLDWTVSCRGHYNDSLFTPPPNEKPQQRFPQAIIIGFGKCGTRALITLMRLHPNIVTTGPEVHFYDNDTNFQKGFQWYRSQMPSSFTNQITVEKTPSYVTSERAMKEIYKLNKYTKLIVIMKDPVKVIMAMSYKVSHIDVARASMTVKDGELQVNPDAYSVSTGSYVNHLLPWFKTFPRSQIHIIEGADLISDPLSEIQKTEKFLGVQSIITENNIFFNETKGFYCFRPFCNNRKAYCLPEAKGKKYPQIGAKIEKKLYDYFRGINEDLFSLIGRRFLWEP